MIYVPACMQNSNWSNVALTMNTNFYNLIVSKKKKGITFHWLYDYENKNQSEFVINVQFYVFECLDLNSSTKYLVFKNNFNVNMWLQIYLDFNVKLVNWNNKGNKINYFHVKVLSLLDNVYFL